MSEHASASRHALAEWARIASAELDEIVGRIVRPDSHLVLEQESVQWWIVVDRANRDAVMMRADHDLCVRFMRAFAERHPEATVDLPDIEFLWRVAQAFGTLSEREAPSGCESEAGLVSRKDPSPSRSESASNVYPIFHAQLDESA